MPDLQRNEQDENHSDKHPAGNDSKCCIVRTIIFLETGPGNQLTFPIPSDWMLMAQRS